ncbi:hypothetical protein QWY77_04235 [Thalassotalea ponticola]|nr:hypothetical protein [Thalassotalea ponticola]
MGKYKDKEEDEEFMKLIDDCLNQWMENVTDEAAEIYSEYLRRQNFSSEDAFIDPNLILRQIMIEKNLTEEELMNHINSFDQGQSKVDKNCPF